MASAQVRDVAARAGVSPATVSNALNHPEKVSPHTLQRVQAAIADLDYVRNEAARQLRQQRNRAVGMIVLDVANPFFASVAQSAEATLAAMQRPLLLGNSGQDIARERAHLQLFEEHRVAGLLISPAGDVLPQLRKIKDRGTAVVIVDRKSGAEEFSSVSTDDVFGGQLAVGHLLDKGRTRTAVIGGPLSIHQVAHRYHGAQRAIETWNNTASQQVQVEFIDTGAMNIQAGRQAVQQLLDREPTTQPDAIFATNDLVALGALQALSQAGRAVPDDVALIGYDDIEFAASATVPISSVQQPTEPMGQRAASLVLNAIEDPDADVVHPVFTPSLVQRESTVG